MHVNIAWQLNKHVEPFPTGCQVYSWQVSSSILSAPQIDSGGLQKFRMRLGLAILPYIILYNQGSTPSCRRPGQYAPVVTPPSYTSPLARGGSSPGDKYLALLKPRVPGQGPANGKWVCMTNWKWARMPVRASHVHHRTGVARGIQGNAVGPGPNKNHKTQRSNPG